MICSKEEVDGERFANIALTIYTPAWWVYAIYARRVDRVQPLFAKSLSLGNEMAIQ
jgi:hypothetical protein